MCNWGAYTLLDASNCVYVPRRRIKCHPTRHIHHLLRLNFKFGQGFLYIVFFPFVYYPNSSVSEAPLRHLVCFVVLQDVKGTLTQRSFP